MSARSVAAIAMSALLCAGAQGQVFEYEFTLDGERETPPVVTDGRGTATVVLDQGAGMIKWEIEFGDLSGPATAAHFHGPAQIGEPAASGSTSAPSAGWRAR